jgi:DNA-directed RNA polymerase subunit beta
MGSNMQRQAVPLVRTPRRWSAPAWKASWRATRAVTVVARVTAWSSRSTRSIVVKPFESGEGDPLGAKPDIYNLIKFQRSNQNTCMNQKPIVQRGDKVRAGDVIATVPRPRRASCARPEPGSSRSCRGRATTSRTRS